MPELSLRLDDLPGVFVPLPGAPRLALPIDEVRVSAGFPSPAADYADNRLDINEYLIRNPVSTFFFSVEGDSMQGAEIFDGDILVVDDLRERHGCPDADHERMLQLQGTPAGQCKRLLARADKRLTLPAYDAID